eukprot:COSAG05_NODE_4754_length_1384_cov_5.750195_2_plen_188_part_00
MTVGTLRVRNFGKMPLSSIDDFWSANLAVEDAVPAAAAPTDFRRKPLAGRDGSVASAGGFSYKKRQVEGLSHGHSHSERQYGRVERPQPRLAAADVSTGSYGSLCADEPSDPQAAVIWDMAEPATKKHQQQQPSHFASQTSHSSIEDFWAKNLASPEKSAADIRAEEEQARYVAQQRAAIEIKRKRG